MSDVERLREVLRDMNRDIFTANGHVDRWKESIEAHVRQFEIAPINTAPCGYVLVPEKMNDDMRASFYGGSMDLSYGGWVDPDSCWSAVLEPFVAETKRAKSIRAHVLDLVDEAIDFHPEPLAVHKLQSVRESLAGMLSLLSDLVDMEGPLPGNLNWHKRASEVLAKATGDA